MISFSSSRLLSRGVAAGSLIVIGFFLGRHSAAPGPVQAPDGLAARPPLGAARAVFPGGVSPAGLRDESGASRHANTEVAQAWNAFQRAQCTPASEAAMSDRLKTLAADDPALALQLAQAAATPRQRENFRNAVLQGWATRDAEAAARWALANVRSEERRVAIEAIAGGAIDRPEEAVRAFEWLMTADPRAVGDHGNALTFAFAHAGQFELAARFAADGPAEHRAAWLCTVFNQWAMYQPQASLAAVAQIEDPAARGEAMQGLVAGWSSSDPAGLVSYAQTLPAGETRLNALRDGLSQWVYRDPKAATEWMDAHDPNPDLDAGAAAVAVLPALVEQKPDIAASWAESITDPELRINTLLDLIRIWGARDPVGARGYAATTAALPADRRELALSSLQPSP